MTKEELEILREYFINWMTKDSKTKDKRKKEFNQGIFYMYPNCEEHRQCFNNTNMEMVLEKFDKATRQITDKNFNPEWEKK